MDKIRGYSADNILIDEAPSKCPTCGKGFFYSRTLDKYTCMCIVTNINERLNKWREIFK